MVRIPEIKSDWDFTVKAAKEHKRLMTLPLKNKLTANVLWNENSVDCFIMKDGFPVEAYSHKGSAENLFISFTKIFDSLKDLI